MNSVASHSGGSQYAVRSFIVTLIGQGILHAQLNASNSKEYNEYKDKGPRTVQSTRVLAHTELLLTVQCKLTLELTGPHKVQLLLHLGTTSPQHSADDPNQQWHVNDATDRFQVVHTDEAIDHICDRAPAVACNPNSQSCHRSPGMRALGMHAYSRAPLFRAAPLPCRGTFGPDLQGLFWFCVLLFCDARARARGQPDRLGPAELFSRKHMVLMVSLGVSAVLALRSTWPRNTVRVGVPLQPPQQVVSRLAFATRLSMASPTV